ncbi:alpha/beta fold hydrolase [Streptomyces bambusae]|uniref:thioesterase II family protein n=1 Tax=Streptomyces bambusae TaxID=1550616 RepID=UPI001CFE2786|nr:alpha/beta fold hydrolase [Streptomyces bambusae]MCB5165663.1 alpha/beta fold hydrolase [Streptomyces bambusae]
MTRWLHCPVPRPGAAHRLVCFAHAGGSAAYFHAWAAGLPGAEVHAVRYPGRADRLHEPFADGLHAMARDVAEELAAVDDGRPAVLFGHSMGALLAYETARLLAGGPAAPAHLIASAAGAPLLRRTARPAGADDADDDALVATLAALGGTAPELLTDRALRAYVLPYVRADFALVRGYVHRPGPPLDCPLTTITAADDRHVRPADVAAWAAHTRAGHRARTVPGGHFYLTAAPPFAIIGEALAEGLADGPAAAAGTAPDQRRN